MRAERTDWHDNAHRCPWDALEGKYHVEDHGFRTPCLVWSGPLDRRGRPHVRYHLRTWAAYRLSYEWFVGAIPDGLEIDHLCRVPACINPRHLEPVTKAENIRRAGLFKLTGEDIVAIRSRLAQGHRQVDIASDFGVSQRLISRIKNEPKVWIDKRPHASHFEQATTR